MQAKTLQVREHELQQMMATPEGRRALEEIANRYEKNGGSHRQEKASIITYIIVHERQHGMIVG